MALHIVQGDLVRMETDAVVNAANAALIEGGGVCGAIFANSNREALSRACRELSPCPTGSAVITKSYGLKAPYIIHAVGPVWKGGNSKEPELLKSAYKKSLSLAREKGLKSVVFPLISGGIYGYPKEQAMEVAIRSIEEFIKEHPMEVYLVFLEKHLAETAKQIKEKI